MFKLFKKKPTPVQDLQTKNRRAAGIPTTAEKLMKINYITPAGTVWKLGQDIAKEHHVLIAGTTGSGKSTLLNSFMYTALHDSPAQIEFILVDLKRVELADYQTLPHLIQYCVEPEEAIAALDRLIDIMEKRFEIMDQKHIRQYDGTHIWYVVDELADLISQRPRDVITRICRIGRLGRATNIHLLLCTQDPSKKTIPAQIVQNMTCRIALRCMTAIESRQIINLAGAERLPRYGQALFLNAEGLRQVVVPMTDREDIQRIVDYWTSPGCFFYN